jgi:hypothetical protein
MAELANQFAWSWKRHQTFYECPRKLYWMQYGSWGGWESDATRETALAYRLSKIKNLAMLVGEAFHEELAGALHQRPPAPGPVPAKELADKMERRLLRRVGESRNRDWKRHGPKEAAILFEDYYGDGITGAMSEAAVADLRACAQGLAGSPFGRRVFSMDPDHLKFVDPKGQFGRKRLEMDGLVVWASPDLIASDNKGDLHIIDWKTGKQQAKANLAQVAAYGLFVAQQFETPIERITAHLVYVRANSHQTYERLSDGVAEAKRFIAMYVADVKSRLTNVERNEARDMTRFPMTTNLATCARCNFKELCGR